MGGKRSWFVKKKDKMRKKKELSRLSSISAASRSLVNLFC
jgi:hypothetical protein